ncbi:cadherin-related tumor suppressor-like [Haliotis asinina]|uniref:cadherin-related tumor suppressor-like n=1 Tax=Haliotis asinina TaxID=109174 RepID=UPI003531B4D2
MAMGEVLVSDSLIRPPIQDVYRLSIRAGDSGYPSLFEDTEVTVDVSNNKPAQIPEDLTLTVEESTSVGGYVGEVMVIDPDASPLYPVIFSLLDYLDTFHIDSTSGEITTVVTLDAERQSQYITRVQIEDHGIPTHVMTATVTVNIADINDNYPMFSSPMGYAVTIEENDAELETAILTLKPAFVVTDSDTRDNNFVYELLGQYSEHFEMDERSGVITLAPDIDIDCERVCEYNLKINVTDEGGVGLTSTAPLHISVEDINDNPPDITPDVVYSVSPNASVGEVVGKVHAVDRDISDQNHQLTFTLTNGGFGKFAVGFDTGIITVADNLTREPLLDKYRLQFTVRDSGFPSLSSEALYTVHVPINRRPVFKNTKVSVHVPEDVEIGYVIADVGVDDEDSMTGGISDITYNLEGDQGLFTIDRYTGLIITKALLDAEQSASVDMTATIVDAGIPTYTGTTAVHVDIQGVNDNIPTFSSSTGYTAIIREDVGVRSTGPVEVVLTPGLAIADEDGDDVHVHLSGDGAELFAVDQSTRTITLEEPDSIDCERQCLYNLSIIASDSGSPELTSSAELTIQIEDVNEHAPEFAKTYVYPVRAAAPVGTLIGYVEAMDKDFGDRNSDVSYVLKSGGYDKFAVHSDTGAITVADSLIREPQLKQYDLQVEARDLGYPQRSAETTVVIKVPVNEEPVFANTMVYNVSEDYTVGDIIGTVKAEDVDLGVGEKQYLTYSILGGDGVFSVDRRTGDIILFDDLDAESRSSYELKVKVEDHGYPSLTSTGSLIINVDDVNDNPPVFTAPQGYIARVSEMADVTVTPIVEIVPELSVLDADVEGTTENIRFGLEGVGRSDFHLDPVTGQLTVHENATFDADLQQIYKLKITATDKGGTGLKSTASLNITIEDVNDNPPVFRETLEGILSPLVVDPSSPIGTVIYTFLADDADVDADNKRITYMLQSGGYGKFSVDPFSGEVKIADDLTRDPLEKDYYLRVKAVDSGAPPLSADTVLQLHVPLNTRPQPQSDLQLQVPENITVGDVVGVVYIRDFDSQTDGFEYLLDTAVSEFTIDPLRGEIRTVKPLDAEFRSEYILPITVIDRGFPTHTVSTTATVMVTDVDDNLPQFSALTEYTATLQEGRYDSQQELILSPGLSIWDRDISDSNSDYRVYLKGHGSNMFQITPDGNHILLKGSSMLDAENVPDYHLQIIAESVQNDWRHSGANLTISVEDTNDHAPYLPHGQEFTVDPSSSVGTVVGTIVAVDKDVVSPNSDVMYIMREDGFGKFGIDIDNGNIFVKNSLTLEPTLDLYELQVAAIDKGYPALTGSTTVIVNVPVNKPITVPESLMFSVDEDVDIGKEVGRINITQPDGGSGTVEYRLLNTGVPFTIDTSEGIIRTSSSLDADSEAEYSLEVGVANLGVPTYTSTTSVTVTVSNINDNPPKFTSAQGYTATVVENFHVTLLDVIPTVSVIDLDSRGTVMDVEYSLGGNNSDLFTINPVSAAVSIKDPQGLDAEHALVYNLTITATDENGKGLKTHADLKVKVKDVNDNSPRFDYHHVVKVDPRSPVGYEVATVKAVDDDGSPENSRLMYFLKDGVGKFRINPLTGTILLSSRLTEEPLSSEYSLGVRVVDSGFPPQTAETTVKVLVELNQPALYELTQDFHVTENRPSGTMVGILEFTDPDGKALEFTSLDHSVPLAVDRTTGMIQTTGSLDREKSASVSLPVQVVDQGAPSFTGTIVVTIHILDINDNSPTFSVADGYHGVVPETFDSHDPYTVYLNQPIVVADADPDADLDNIQLSLTGPGSDLFRIDPASGHLILTTPQKVDSETQATFNLTLTAVDDSNGKTLKSSVPLFIDVDDFNDNSPEFKDDFEFEVATNTPVGAEIGTVVATDRDISERNNKLTYILKSGGYGKFELDSDTGVLSLSENILREPVLGTYILHIEALDSGEVRLSGDTSVTIRVPVNSPPSIDDSFTFAIEENKPVGSVVGEVTLDDPDTASNQYETFEFAVTDEQAPFEFRGKTGVLTTKRGLDREKEEYFTVPVRVVNPGAPAFTVTTTVTVTVTDVNDNIPVFSSPTGYVASMMENTITEFLEMSDVVSVVDADATEAYRLITLDLGGEGSDKFILDTDSGRIRLRTPSKLDAEEQSSYNLTITATDESGKGKNSSASLTVTIGDVNDNAPVFPGRYNLSIAAGTRVGEVVGTIKSTDRDIHRKNNRVTYLLRGGAFGKFDLDPDSGDIVALEKLTVEPFRHVYHLSVEAIDSGDQRLSAETVVTINVNLNKPPVVPTTFQFEVKENQIVGSEVGRVKVTDPDLEYNDGEKIQFFIGEPGVPFMVERDTGVVRMATELDRETNDHFEMSVIVVNEGSPSYTATTHIVVGIVDLNDNAPVFSASQYTGRVVEDHEGRRDATEVDLDRLILVSDEDVTEDNRGVVLTLTGVGSDKFWVDSDTGHLHVNRPGLIDCELTCQYNLMLYATDQNGKGLTSSANLTIKVEDVNDHSPEFEDKYEFTVNTGAHKGTHIGMLVATDMDDTVKNNQLTYFLTDGGHGKFDVNPRTGALYVSDTLKREPYHDVFSLHVQAVDNGFPRQSADTTVKIHVPMNKAPTVDKVMSLTMMENLPAGTMVGKVKAVDPDMGVSPEETLEYLITDTSVPVMVDKYSGELKLKSSVDREELDSVSFNVQVINDGAPAYTMSTLVTITVNDTNDHAPEFTVKGGYSGVVSETVSTSRGDVYVKLSQPITVEDKDDTFENRNVKVTLTGHGSDNFEFEEETGRIKIRDPSLIDAEVQKSFNLKLTATDQGGHGSSTSANISIMVDDINDNRPVFVSNTTFNMNPSAMSSSKVGMVRARDADATAQNNRITYLLTGGGHGKFTIDSGTGEIFVTESPNHESMMDVYHLDIRAQDNGVPQMSADTVVTVNVPINHPPRMSLPKYEFHLPENNAVDAVVGRVTAVDPDIPADPHHKLTYSIDDASGLFSIRPDTGVITANEVLDREVTASVVFDVQVKDNVYPENSDTANVKVIIIDLNDNAPMLTGGSYYRGAVFEDNKRPLRGQIVKLDRNITVIDRDATDVHRDFVVELEGYASRFFLYNPATGQLSVRTPGSIDREFNEAYEMKIVARDRSFSWLSSTATLRIDVADSNDNYPEFLETSFTFTLPSVVNAGDIAGKVVARDIDATEPNNKILYLLQDNPLGKFKLDINTGDLILLPSFFSKPRKDVYRVTVEARDLGYPSRKAQTNVIVRAPYFDFNDHPPDFKGETMFVTREEIPIGAVVGRLNVVDEDKEGSSAVTLELLHTGIAVPFKVEADGSITCSERIDRDHGPKYYTFKVRATDNGTPPFNVTRDISVIVDDINDNPPKFPLPKYKHMVSDIFPPRTVVATPFAFDNVDETDSVYHYTMKGDNLGYFHINEKTGVVVTTDMASTLDPQTITYQIEAVDLYNKSLKAVTELEIQVIESLTPSNSTC